MNPKKVDRNMLEKLTDLPNIGKSMAGDLESLGISEPVQLVGRSPLEMYERLCEQCDCRLDPCVLDVFMSVVRFMEGEDPRPWWEYTAERKLMLAKLRDG